MLSVLTGVKPAGDKDYQEFVRETRFDYARDLTALAGASDGEQLFLLARGSFDWDKLRHYATSHGGNCRDDYCAVPTGKTRRWANFLPIQSDVIALAVSTNPTAADELRPPGRRIQEQVPAQPVWMRMSHVILKNPPGLPLPLRIFAISFQSADSVTLSLAAPKDAKVAFDIALNAEFANEAMADTARRQLEIQTKMLKLGLARERQRPNPADLTGLLTAGSFQVVNKCVSGTWPVRKELLGALQ